MNSKNTIILVQNISKKFENKEVVKNATLKIKKGKITGIIGRNGSGKTVLLKMIVGLYFPTSGTITIYDGLTIEEDFGVLIDTEFLENETGLKNLVLLACLKSKIGKNEICDVMRFVKLDPWCKTKYKNYSSGMKQKLKLAQAIMEKPKVLVLDEPFNGLDDESVEYFREELLKLKQQGITIIITSHYKEDINELCDEVYKMNGGVLNEKSKEY